jgi:DNA-3-methyladenine glycosylase II
MRHAVRHLKKSDPLMRVLIERVGPCRMTFRPPEFHSLARSIVYQQLNGKAALSIFNRFAELAGDPVTPAGILRLSDEQMRGVGLSKQKSAYLKDLAEKTAAGVLDFSQLSNLRDEEVIEHLTQVKGVGVWTAQMFLMFTLKRENVLPTGDYGVRMAMYRQYLEVQKKVQKAAEKAKGGKKKSSKKSAAKKTAKPKIKLPTPEQMEKIAKSWEPYRSVACWYLWRSLDIKTP